MSEKIRYQIVVEDDYMELESKVEKLMQSGWVPIGGVAINHVAFPNERNGGIEHDFTVAQTMHKPSYDNY